MIGNPPSRILTKFRACMISTLVWNHAFFSLDYIILDIGEVKLPKIFYFYMEVLPSKICISWLKECRVIKNFNVSRPEYINYKKNCQNKNLFVFRMENFLWAWNLCFSYHHVLNSKKSSRKNCAWKLKFLFGLNDGFDTRISGCEIKTISPLSLWLIFFRLNKKNLLFKA